MSAVGEKEPEQHCGTYPIGSDYMSSGPSREEDVKYRERALASFKLNQQPNVGQTFEQWGKSYRMGDLGVSLKQRGLQCFVKKIHSSSLQNVWA